MSETALLTGVRNHLRTQLTLADTECDCELADDVFPATVGRKYIVVSPGGWRNGPSNDGGGVIDELYSVKVTVVLRGTQIPRDRKRSMLLTNLENINTLARSVIAKVHFNTTLLGVINTLITDSSEKFIEMLRFGGMDSGLRVVTGENFAAAPTEQNAGVARTILFTGARRIQTRSSMV